MFCCSAEHTCINHYHFTLLLLRKWTEPACIHSHLLTDALPKTAVTCSVSFKRNDFPPTPFFICCQLQTIRVQFSLFVFCFVLLEKHDKIFIYSHVNVTLKLPVFSRYNSLFFLSSGCLLQQNEVMHIHDYKSKNAVDTDSRVTEPIFNTLSPLKVYYMQDSCYRQTTPLVQMVV